MINLFFFFSQEQGFSLSGLFLNVNNDLRENNNMLYPLSRDKARVKDSVKMVQTGQHLEINSCSLITEVSDKELWRMTLTYVREQGNVSQASNQEPDCFWVTVP